MTIERTLAPAAEAAVGALLSVNQLSVRFLPTSGIYLLIEQQEDGGRVPEKVQGRGSDLMGAVEDAIHQTLSSKDTRLLDEKSPAMMLAALLDNDPLWLLQALASLAEEVEGFGQLLAATVSGAIMEVEESEEEDDVGLDDEDLDGDEIDIDLSA